MPKAFIFFGRSGSGKGTQSKFLREYLEKAEPATKTAYLETGDNLRKFTKIENYTSGLVREIIDNGDLLPEFIPIWIWTNLLIDNFTGKENLIFDGVSRRMAEAPVLDSALKFYGIEKKYVIFINASKEKCKERLLGRGRNDDTSEDIDIRFSWYDTNVLPVIDYFKNKSDYAFIEINGNQAIDEVNEELIFKIGI